MFFYLFLLSLQTILSNSYSRRIIAVGDIHGDFEGLLEILEFSNALDISILITTGDTIDRGDDTIKVLDFFISHNETFHLLGNHEQMNLLGMFDYVSEGDIQTFGGRKIREKAFLRKGKYRDYLMGLEIAKQFGDILFVHAGISLEIALRYRTLENINSLFWKDSELKGNNGPVWYRGYAKGDEKVCVDLGKTLEVFGAKFMVMGHTPFKKITTMCEGKAIFIDTGISYALSKRPSALEVIQEDGKTMRINALYPDKVVKIYELNTVL